MQHLPLVVGKVDSQPRLAGILVQVVFSWAALYTPVLNRLLGTRPVEAWLYTCAWLGVPLILLADLARKRVALRLRRRRTAAAGAGSAPCAPPQ